MRELLPWALVTLVIIIIIIIWANSGVADCVIVNGLEYCR